MMPACFRWKVGILGTTNTNNSPVPHRSHNTNIANHLKLIMVGPTSSCEDEVKFREFCTHSIHLLFCRKSLEAYCGCETISNNKNLYIHSATAISSHPFLLPIRVALKICSKTCDYRGVQSTMSLTTTAQLLL